MRLNFRGWRTIRNDPKNDLPRPFHLDDFIKEVTFRLWNKSARFWRKEKNILFWFQKPRLSLKLIGIKFFNFKFIFDSSSPLLKVSRYHFFCFLASYEILNDNCSREDEGAKASLSRQVPCFRNHLGNKWRCPVFRSLRTVCTWDRSLFFT